MRTGQSKEVNMPSALLRGVSPSVLVVAIYSHFSSDLQRDASILDQNRSCATEIERQGWRAGPVFSDRALSGGITLRSGYQDLLDGVRRRAFDVIMAEALDRLSRDPEDLAALYKRCEFAGIRIFTLAEGWINELHVGLKGTMSALFLKDLAEKTRRGLRGRVTAGASAGGLSYGYAVVPVPEGEDRGARVVKPVEAAVVVRIHSDYANGISPKAIAAALNREGVPGPRGRGWSQSTINGNRRRGTGLLNNELYVGFLVWNRLCYRKDPETDKRRSKHNPAEDWLVVSVPHLRIVGAELWDRVKARQATLDAAATPAADGSTFQSMQRPKGLLSKLLRCAACGGGCSKISATHVGCSNARNKGDAVCVNRRTVKLTALEATVLEALRTRLMAPEVYAAFVRGFTAEWNSEQKVRAVAQEGQRDELRRVTRKIDNFVDAIGEGNGSAAVLAALKEAEARKVELEGELAVAGAPAPRLMPNLADLYRTKVAALQEVLETEDADATREQVQGADRGDPTDPRPRRSEGAVGDRGCGARWRRCWRWDRGRARRPGRRWRRTSNDRLVAGAHNQLELLVRG